MPKRSQAQTELPPAVRAALRELGANLSLARKRRRESLKTWAARIGVSEPTLARMEQGDPGVAAGTYATALWMIGRATAIAELAAPQFDLGALEAEVRVARQRAVRSPVSLGARLRGAEQATDCMGEGDGDAQAAPTSVEPRPQAARSAGGRGHGAR